MCEGEEEKTLCNIVHAKHSVLMGFGDWRVLVIWWCLVILVLQFS